MVIAEADKKSEQNAVPAESYKMLDADRDLVLSAASSLDVPVNIRNKLYAALNRALKKPWVSPNILARWSEDQTSSTAKFNFLKEWCKDTTFNAVTIEEKHTKKSEDFRQMTIGWLTKLDLELKYKVATNPAGRAYVDKLMKGQSKPHPFFPRDKEMRLYKHLSDFTEGRIDSNVHEKGFSVKGEMEGNADIVTSLAGQFGSSMLSDADNAGFQPAVDETKPKGKGKAKAKAAPSSPGPEGKVDKKPKDGPKAIKLALLLNKVNGKEIEMNMLRNQLGTVKPNMKNILDSHLQQLEDIKSKLEPAALAGDEDVDLSNEVVVFLGGKEMKSDIQLAAKSVKGG